MCDRLLRTWEMVSCIACVLARWGPILLAYCCLTAKGWGLGSLIQAPSWKDLSTWFLRVFIYPPLCLRIHSYVYSLTCCSHSGCEFSSVLRDHTFHLRWKRWKEVSFLWDLGIRQKGYVSTGRGRRGVRVKYVSSSFPPAAYWLPCAISGNFEVGVHIADVSYFVLEETALDKVASERATSVYLVQKVRTTFPFFVWQLCLLFTIDLF